MGTPRSTSGIALLLIALLLPSCIYKLTLHAPDGEQLDGQWHFGREGGGSMQVVAADGELLVGALEPLARRSFLDGYQDAFGRGSIGADGPDLSAYGNGLWTPPGSSNALLEMVYGESFNPAAEQSRRIVAGPLFYWRANLRGERKTHMQCFLIGSSRTGSGLGRCKSLGGKEYTVEF